MWSLVYAVFLSYICSIALGHVSLTFPPARFPPLDFLDNIRTAAPCGVDRNAQSKRTTLQSGRDYNMTWHLGFAHQGGIKIELLDPTGLLMEQLTPADPIYASLDDQTRQYYVVKLPEQECLNCSIRLLRQAVEWGDYTFSSCADVDIVANPTSPNNDCFGHGTSSTDDSGNSFCQCEQMYYGEFCQYQEDCLTDEDCSGAGRCAGLDATTMPRNKCYCQPGYYGIRCESQFTPSAEDLSDGCFNFDAVAQTTDFDSVFNKDCYNHKAIGPQENIYWRIIKDTEIEMIMEFVSQTWISMGWRPTGIDAACYNFPVPRGTPPADSLHPMDCQDIVIGSVYGDRYSNVGDFYTRDRSTPLRDSVYGGADSLTAAYGYQNQDKRIIMFRRPLQTNDAADHAFTLSGPDFVIWAKGMEPGSYSFHQPSGLDVGKASDPNFYHLNELKYHGNRNRGATTINFFDASANVPDTSFGGGAGAGPEPEPIPEHQPGDSSWGEQYTGYPEPEPEPGHTTQDWGHPEEHTTHGYPHPEPEPEPTTENPQHIGGEPYPEPHPGYPEPAHPEPGYPEPGQPHPEPEHENTVGPEPEPEHPPQHDPNSHSGSGMLMPMSFLSILLSIFLLW